MYLEDSTNDQIKTEAKDRGYTFTDSDCDDLRAESFEGETLNEALSNYLKAYER